MATAEEMGFALPAGDDYIREGDDAISQNARVAAKGIEEARWDRTADALLSTADIWTLPPGKYRPVSNSAATAMGLPTANIGNLEITNIGTSRLMVWTPVSSVPRFFSNRRVGANWSGWAEFTPVPATPAGNVEREMRLARANSRRGGRYGTNGVAVVSFVFDHGTNYFMSQILPMLADYAIPATLGLNSQMYSTAYMFNTSDNATSFSALQTMALNNGVSLWNHGRLHNAGGESEIIGGRDELQASLPQIPIENWLHTGAYADFSSGADFAKYWEHDIGAVILNGHAYATGDIQEPVMPLNGQPKPGMDGQWIDAGASAVAGAKTAIQEAQKTGAGVMIRHHPMYLDDGEHLTSAQLRELIRWAAAERDAGRLLILTADLLNLADAGSAERRNLTDGSGGTGNQTRTVSLKNNALAAGSVNELLATVRLTAAGTVRLTAAGTGLSVTKTLPVKANTWTDLRQFFTIPLTATGSLTVKAELVTGAGLSVHQLNVYPG